jgi:O-antigen/teichoic acid export membrane protein
MTQLISDHRHQRRSWLRNAGWLTAANVLSLASSAVVGLALVRVFGAKDLGLYSLATVSAVMGTALAGFRLEQHLLTRLNLDGDDERRLGVAMRASYLVYVPAAVVAVAVVVLTLDGSLRTVGLLAVAEVGVMPLVLARVVLQVSMRQRDALACTAGSRLSWVLLVGLLILLGAASVPAVVAARIASTLVEATLLTRATGYTPLRLLRVRAPLSESIADLRSSAPLASSGMAGELHGRIDQPLIAAIRSSRELGVYAAAVRVADLAGILAPVMQTVVAPGLIDAARSEDAESFNSVLCDGLLLTLLPSALVIALTMGQSRWIVATLLGHSFVRAAPLVVVLAAAEWVTFVGAAFTVGLLATGRRRLLAVASVGGLGSNVVGNVIWLPHHGITAAAWTTLLGCACAGGVAMFGSPENRRSLSVTAPIVLQSAAAVVACAVTTYWLRSNVPLSLVIGALAYLAVALAARREEMRRVLTLVRRTTPTP